MELMAVSYIINKEFPLQLCKLHTTNLSTQQELEMPTLLHMLHVVELGVHQEKLQC